MHDKRGYRGVARLDSMRAVSQFDATTTYLPTAVEANESGIIEQIGH